MSQRVYEYLANLGFGQSIVQVNMICSVMSKARCRWLSDRAEIKRMETTSLFLLPWK